MNSDVFLAASEYAKWYVERFGDPKPDWYVFPFGKTAGQDPTHPQTSMKTAWRNTRADSGVEGRFHDTRHTFVTDLAESGAGDQVIQDMVGHVSKDMVKHYSHIRTEAKRRAHRNVIVHIIVDLDKSFTVVETMQSPDGLLQRTFPGDRHGKEERVEARVVKPSPI
jgi:hypothetical protein